MAMALFSSRFRNNARLQRASDNNPPLKQGEQGDAVALLQQALVDTGLPMPISMAKGKADGIYGNETTKTVKDFQRREGLQQDGIAGRQTLARLDAIFKDRPELDSGEWAVTTLRADPNAKVS
jgi:peptidoglycan hydrolase-like protein with peptidoglycan-binding domain